VIPNTSLTGTVVTNVQTDTSGVGLTIGAAPKITCHVAIAACVAVFLTTETLMPANVCLMADPVEDVTEENPSTRGTPVIDVVSAQDGLGQTTGAAIWRT
jgi:uncharacterized membrane-anchored protein